MENDLTSTETAKVNETLKLVFWEQIHITNEEINNNKLFKEFIYKSIYRWWKPANNIDIATLARAVNRFNRLFLIFWIVLMGTIFLGYFWVQSFVIWVITVTLTLRQELRLRFYNYLLAYFELKDKVFYKASEFERKVSDDIIDQQILPSQIEDIRILIQELSAASNYLDDTLTKLHSSSIYFNKKTFSNIETFLNIEIWWFRKFFTYILSLIKKWLEWHKEELNEEYFRLEKQIRDIESNSPELASTLELSSERFKQHIETTEKVITRI